MGAAKRDLLRYFDNNHASLALMPVVHYGLCYGLVRVEPLSMESSDKKSFLQIKELFLFVNVVSSCVYALQVIINYCSTTIDLLFVIEEVFI